MDEYRIDALPSHEMTKPVNLTIQLQLPDNSPQSTLEISAEGEIRLVNETGTKIIPEKLERVVFYDRPRKPKVQARQTFETGHISVGGLGEMTAYDSIFVIDTNFGNLRGRPVSVACVVRCWLTREDSAFRVNHDTRLNFYEFHHLPKIDAERFAIVTLTDEILGPEREGQNFAIVTDTALDLHDQLNARVRPIYGDRNLPPGFTLFYASADTGHEFLNAIMRFCDKQATSILRHLRNNGFPQELDNHSPSGGVVFRKLWRNDLKIVNPIIRGMAINAETQVGLHFR